MPASRQTGFSLIELVIVMIVISVGLLGIASLFSNTSSSLSINESLLRTTQYTQECAEQVIATRRDLGFASINANLCDSLTLPGGFTRSLNVSAPYSGSTGSPCPSGANNCKDVLITVANGSQSSSLTLMLVNY